VKLSKSAEGDELDLLLRTLGVDMRNHLHSRNFQNWTFRSHSLFLCDVEVYTRDGILQWRNSVYSSYRLHDGGSLLCCSSV